MFCSSILRWVTCCIAFLMVSNGCAVLITEQQWLEYKTKFEKDFSDVTVPEAYCRYYFNYNLALINSYNATLVSYKLRENQFTDLRFVQFNALFPEAINSGSLPPDTSVPDLQDAAPSIDFRTLYGFNIPVENQGIVCNSGWAYATAKALEIFSATNTGELTRLSAQNLIDCAGGARGCKNQVPEKAFDFLTFYGQPLHDEASYRNTNTSSGPGMCVYYSAVVPKLVTLGKFGIISDGDDELLKRLVSNGFPVVVEFNPTTFQFMHYGSGIFEPPVTVNSGSHFMVVVGYGAENGVDFWLLLNSFGEYWGEKGYIRIKRDPTKPIAKNAIYPKELA